MKKCAVFCSCKDIETYMKVFQAFWLEDIKYIDIYIIIAALWLNNILCSLFFLLRWKIRGDSVVSDFSHSV